jgi:endoglucanase
MWNDGGWALSYSVGDTYTPDSISAGLKVTDAEITGPGLYTVGIDFSGTQQGVSNSVAFAAIGILNGEKLFPNYIIDIKEVLINGEIYRLKGRAYTTSDNSVTTRVNLFNEWVTSIPVGTARMHYGNLAGATPTPINRNDAAIAKIETIYITFEYSPMKTR